MIQQIELRNLLPKVFLGEESAFESKNRSQIWNVPSFRFKKGCRICIHAESGAGKTSLISFIYGLRKDYCGNIFFDEKAADKLTTSRWQTLRTRAIALLPQELKLFPELTVMQNIELKNQLTHHKTQKEVELMLKQLKLSHKKEWPVARLSIGQQQRVAIVRALCQPFDFLFLDEPVSHLDVENNKSVAEMIAYEAQQQGAGVVATSVGNSLLLHEAENIYL